MKEDPPEPSLEGKEYRLAIQSSWVRISSAMEFLVKP